MSTGRMLAAARARRLGGMMLIAVIAADSILPEDTSGRVVWAVVAVLILGLYYVMKQARKNAARRFRERKRAEQERIDNDPDMRKD